MNTVHKSEGLTFQLIKHGHMATLHITKNGKGGQANVWHLVLGFIYNNRLVYMLFELNHGTWDFVYTSILYRTVYHVFVPLTISGYIAVLIYLEFVSYTIPSLCHYNNIKVYCSFDIPQICTTQYTYIMSLERNHGTWDFGYTSILYCTVYHVFVCPKISRYIAVLIYLEFVSYTIPSLYH